MREKMIIAIKKLNNTSITIANAHMYYNMYLIKQVYFGCEVIKLTPKQEKTLLEISERAILKKLGLSEKFPRAVLHSRKTALGVGLMKPTTIVNILTLKLCVGHKRFNDRIAKIIGLNEEEATYQNGCKEHVCKTSRRFKMKE